MDGVVLHGAPALLTFRSDSGLVSTPQTLFCTISVDLHRDDLDDCKTF